MAIERMPKDGGKTVPVKASLSDVVKGTPKGQKAVDMAMKKSAKDQEKVSKKAKQTEVKKIHEKVSTEVKGKSKKKLQVVDKSKKKKASPNKKSPNNGRRGRIDWVAARNDYTTDASMSYAKIAEKYGCAKRSVEQRAKKEDWVKVRQSVGEIILAEVSKLTAQSADEANTRHRSIWSEAQEMVLTRLRHIRKNAEDDLKFIPKEMKAVVEALKITVEGERTAIGLPNSVIRNQNENKDVDDFEDVSDEELESIINEGEVEPNEHDIKPPKAANSTAESKDRTAPKKKS